MYKGNGRQSAINSSQFYNYQYRIYFECKYRDKYCLKYFYTSEMCILNDPRTIYCKNMYNIY